MPRLLLLVLVSLYGASAVAAELPPMPDEARYPQLVAMKKWLESGAEGSRHCALSGGLFAEASSLYRLNRSEPQTLESMMKRHASSLGAADRERLRTTMAHVAGMAAGFADLGEDSAQIAYAQLCIGRARQPSAVLSNERIRGQFEAALRCERANKEGTLERKECVAGAFRL
jgi:hypothetical protein